MIAWRAHREVAVLSEVLPYETARASPCVGCAAPCCTVLPLYDFPVARLPDLEYARYLLNFDRIELAIIEDGRWRAHYRAPCRNLDRQTARCRVHGTPDQPMVCKKYDAHACYYKRIFAGDGYEGMVRIDRGRLAAWSAHCQFNAHRDLVAAPEFARLLEWLPPLAPVADSALPVELPDDPVLDRWRALARGEAVERLAEARTWAQLRDPCAGCHAWCCTRLSFPHTTPANASQLDHIRFVLGFEGVEVLVDAQDQWTVEVTTRCRHREETPDGGRCGVFGQPERPGVCDRYDALSCAYKGRLSRPRSGVARITAEAFSSVADGFAFGPGGEVVHRPAPAEVVARVEAAWAAAP